MTPESIYRIILKYQIRLLKGDYLVIYKYPRLNNITNFCFPMVFAVLGVPEGASCRVYCT